MSDNQSQSVEYEGLEPATATSSAPAFGDVQQQSAPVGDQEISTLPGIAPYRAPCSNADCGNSVAHPSETAWQQLLSAVPVQDQLFRLRPRVEGMSYPTEDDFRAAVAAVRPEHTDEHSLARLRQGWTEEVAGKLGDWSERIRSNLTDLSEGWSGTDFEAFVQVCDETRELVDGVLEDVDGTVASLQSTEEMIYTLQGGDSGEVPYPAPQFWIEGEWHSWVSVHIRPAWWHGDCIRRTCEEAEHVVQLAGADPEMATEIIDYIDERVEHYIDYYQSPANIEADGLDPKGITVDEAKELAVADAMSNYGGTVEQNWSDYDSRHRQVDEEIVQRSDDNESEQQSMRTSSSDKQYPEVADQSRMDLEPPSMDRPSGTASPESTQDPSLEPPTGDPGGDGPPPKPDEDDDQTSGGLASGGPGGGSIGGGYAGGMGGATTGTGGGGSPTGAAASGASLGASAAGAAAGNAAAAGAAKSGGMAGGMMGGAGGGRGMGADGQDRDPDVDLLEDKNMWGFVNEDDDPFA